MKKGVQGGGDYKQVNCTCEHNYSLETKNFGNLWSVLALGLDRKKESVGSTELP